jgi:hypothetical protein
MNEEELKAKKSVLDKIVDSLGLRKTVKDIQHECPACKEGGQQCAKCKEREALKKEIGL